MTYTGIVRIIGIGIPWMDNYRIFRLGRTDNFSIDFFGQGATAQADDYEHCKCGFRMFFIVLVF